jgi:purine-binding chemotaxis protein CheW
LKQASLRASCAFATPVLKVFLSMIGASVHVLDSRGPQVQASPQPAAIEAQLLVFTVDAQHFAIALARVERVVRMVEITPVPGSPQIVLGVIYVEGAAVPVMSLRRRFRLPEAEPHLSDQLVIADTGRRIVALAASSLQGIVSRSLEQVTMTSNIFAGSQSVSGVTRIEEDVVFVHDLERLLSESEEWELEAALTSLAAGEAS